MMADPTDIPDNDDDRFDFNLLRRQLSQSTISSGLSSRNEVWPLQLHTTSVDHFIFGDVIGNGSFAEVRECIDTRTLERCAIKIVNKDYLVRQAPEALLKQLQEINLLKQIKHPNLIRMNECIFQGSQVYIILEHCTFVLSDLLAEQPDRRLCPPIARFLFHQLCTGLEYMHSIGIVHRDVKPQNLLIKNCGTLKIIDFGVSQILSMWTRDDICTNYEGSPLFQAPEVVAGQTEYQGFKVDVWSSGITLYLMLYGSYPFFDDALLGLYDKILSQPHRVPEDDETACRLIVSHLLDMMLEKVAARRANINQVLDHPWLKYQSLHSADEHGEFIDLITSQFNVQMSAPSAPQSQQQEGSSGNQQDIYRSMSVLPYLYRHHFPDVRVRRGSSRLTTPMMSPSTPSSSETSTSSTPAKSPRGSNPHEIIGENDIEWGTNEQYNLMKVPIIRANRTRNRHRRGQKRNRRFKDGKPAGSKKCDDNERDCDEEAHTD